MLARTAQGSASAPSTPGPAKLALYESLLRKEMSLRSIEGPLALVSTAQALAGGTPAAGIALIDDLLASEDPVATLAALRQRIASSEGVLLFASSLLDFGPLRAPGRRWALWQGEMKFFMRREQLHLMLIRAGFAEVWMWRQPLRGERPDASFGVGALGRLASNGVRFCLQTGLIDVNSNALAPVLVSGVVGPRGPKPKISIVMPVYNERATFQQSVEAVLAKNIEGVDKEVIIVESNSSDGTADLARQYAGRPDVRLIFQERPRGKGNAVREGLLAATGTIVLIQDADLEYDVEDYDALIEPLLAYRSMFVLGTRHNGDWKIRRFAGAPLAALFFNLGHVFYTLVLNLLLGERMTDPFTMFKVFHRDALYGLEFICDRFDFDHELVIKLVRKGYRPNEVPVNYVSRSFGEGKKVRVVRDGLTWLWIDLKLRLKPLASRPH